MPSWVKGIHRSEIDEYWPLVESEINRSVSHGEEWTVSEVHEQLKTGCMQLWLIVHEGGLTGVGVTQTCPPILWIIALSGVDWDSWKHVLDPVREWGASVGCEKVRIKGRPGWIKKLKGWRIVNVEMEL